MGYFSRWIRDTKRSWWPPSRDAQCSLLEEEQPLGAAAEARLGEEDTGVFRSNAARGSYLGLDRVDIAYLAKELCRRMSAPDRASRLALQRLVRYLKGSPRFVYSFPWQPECDLDVFVLWPCQVNH